MDKKDVDGYTRAYMELPFEAEQIRFRKRKILELLGQYRHDTVLEVGCGLHSILGEFQDFSKLVVVEPSEEFAKRASDDAVRFRLSPKVEVVPGFVEEKLDLLSKYRFDFILMSELLNEVENPDEVLRAAHQLCSPETVVHINVTNARSFHRLLAVEMGLINSPYDISDQQKSLRQQIVYDLDSLRERVEAAGFKVIESGSYFVKPFTHRQMESLMASGILPENILDGLYGMTRHMPELGSEIFVNVSRS